MTDEKRAKEGAIEEVEDLYRRRDEPAVQTTAAERTEMLRLVGDGSHYLGGESKEEQIANNDMVPIMKYHGSTCGLELRYEKPSLRVFHPLHDLRTEEGLQYPVYWEAGQWLVREALKNGANGNANIPSRPDRDERLRHVYTQKCRDLLAAAPPPPADEDPPDTETWFAAIGRAIGQLLMRFGEAIAWNELANWLLWLRRSHPVDADHARRSGL